MSKRPIRHTLARAGLPVLLSCAALIAGSAASPASAATVTQATDAGQASQQLRRGIAYYWIDWGSFPDLPEDRVLLSGCPGNPAVPADSIMLVLSSASDIDYWKQIEALSWSGNRVGVIETSGGHRGPSSMTLRASDIQALRLVKAGFLNTPKHMYALDHDQVLARAGTCAALHWQRDR